MKKGPKTQTKTIQDILERTERDGECCIWVGAKHVQGYGMMRQEGVMRSVHSVVAELKYGYKPDKYHGKRVTRTCDNIDCVNPDHIIIDSASAIQARADYKGLYAKRKLTMDQANEIRRKYVELGYGAGPKLAKEYGMSTHMIYAIAHNRLYKDRTNESR